MSKLCQQHITWDDFDNWYAVKRGYSKLFLEENSAPSIYSSDVSLNQARGVELPAQIWTCTDLLQLFLKFQPS